MSKWFVRTVRRGRVSIGRKMFAPEEVHMTYDGRLDGKRFLFALYPSLSLVNLWGTEEQAHAINDDGIEQPQCVGGYYPWLFWCPVEER